MIFYVFLNLLVFPKNLFNSDKSVFIKFDKVNRLTKITILTIISGMYMSVSKFA